MKLPNLDTLQKHAGKVVLEMFGSNVRRATAFISPTFVVSANRRHKQRKIERYAEIVVKVGAPNYREREFIALCKKSGTAFPLRQVQLKFFTDGKIVRKRR